MNFSFEIMSEKKLYTQKFMKSCMTTYGIFYTKAEAFEICSSFGLDTHQSFEVSFWPRCMGSFLNFSTLLFLGRVSCHCCTSEQSFDVLIPIKPPFTTLKPHLHYRKKWGRPIKKLVRTSYFCLVNLPCHVFMKWIRTRLFLVLGS